MVYLTHKYARVELVFPRRFLCGTLDMILLSIYDELFERRVSNFFRHT